MEQSGFGLQIGYRDVGSVDAYTLIAKTVDLDLPSSSVGVIDVVHNDLPSQTKGKLPGLIDPEEYEFEVIYEKAGAAELYGLKASRSIKEWVVYIPDGASGVDDATDGSKVEFQGFVSGVGGESETDDGLVTMSVTIQQTGPETFTAAVL